MKTREPTVDVCISLYQRCSGRDFRPSAASVILLIRPFCVCNTIWVPHPRDAFVFVARVGEQGANLLGRVNRIAWSSFKKLHTNRRTARSSISSFAIDFRAPPIPRFLRNRWETNKITVYIVAGNALIAGGCDKRIQSLFRLRTNAEVGMGLGKEYASSGTNDIRGGQGQPPA